MAKLSIVIPAWREPYLDRTVNNIFENATGDIEVIASLDGSLPASLPKEDPRFRIVRHNSPGMRASINAGLAVAGGEYVMKLDAHCGFSYGFDENLLRNMEDNWLVVPRRYSLKEEQWERNMQQRYWDYHYASFPDSPEFDMAVVPWKKPGTKNKTIDDNMIIQGSCWLANRNFFIKNIGFLDDREETYGNFTGEQHELCFKYWLVAGGECKVVKDVWYTHLSKRQSHYSSKIFRRDRKKNSSTILHQKWLADNWMNGKQTGMIHPVSWLIDKFWPVPSWPESRELWKIHL